MLAILFKLLVGISVLDLSQQVHFEIHYRYVMKKYKSVAFTSSETHYYLYDSKQMWFIFENHCNLRIMKKLDRWKASWRLQL